MAAFTTTEERSFAHRSEALRDEIARRNKGRKVKILVGKYAGREASIQGVIGPDKGRWLFLCYVMRADGSGDFLNSDTESRSYRPTDQFHDFSDIAS